MSWCALSLSDAHLLTQEKHGCRMQMRSAFGHLYVMVLLKLFFYHYHSQLSYRVSFSPFDSCFSRVKKQAEVGEKEILILIHK